VRVANSGLSILASSRLGIQSVFGRQRSREFRRRSVTAWSVSNNMTTYCVDFALPEK
jgi:hypothetical protein